MVKFPFNNTTNVKKKVGVFEEKIGLRGVPYTAESDSAVFHTPAESLSLRISRRIRNENRKFFGFTIGSLLGFDSSKKIWGSKFDGGYL